MCSAQTLGFILYILCAQERRTKPARVEPFSLSVSKPSGCFEAFTVSLSNTFACLFLYVFRSACARATNSNKLRRSVRSNANGSKTSVARFYLLHALGSASTCALLVPARCHIQPSKSNHKSTSKKHTNHWSNGAHTRTHRCWGANWPNGFYLSDCSNLNALRRVLV